MKIHPQQDSFSKIRGLFTNNEALLRLNTEIVMFIDKVLTRKMHARAITRICTLTAAKWFMAVAQSGSNDSPIVL
jgi:hypothetical protein